MQILPIKLSYSKILPKLSQKSHIVKNAALGLAFCTCSFTPASCSYDEMPEIVRSSVSKDSISHKYFDDKIIPDTVNQPLIQDINDIHERINTVFASLDIIEQTKNINDIKSMEFDDANNNKYNISDICKTDKGYEFRGTVMSDGAEKGLLVKFTDGEELIDKPLVCMETTFNKMHNLSMIYQSHWRLGKDGNPERRIFQNRINQNVDSIDRSKYYPYDIYNVFALRKTENGISSKPITDNQYLYSGSDEIKNLKIVYR